MSVSKRGESTLLTQRGDAVKLNEKKKSVPEVFYLTQECHTKGPKKDQMRDREKNNASFHRRPSVRANTRSNGYNLKE